MGKLKALDENANINGKRILVRVDLNVPIKDNKVTDDSRIKKIIPILKELILRNSKIILISHLGRPKGKYDKKLSLEPISQILEKLLNTKVHFSNEITGLAIIEKSNKINSGEILLIENIRFHKDEELNRSSFAKELSKLGDIYINEAFSCSHRAHASVCEITNHIDSYAGKLLIEEVNVINTLNDSAKIPISCIIGGSKISTKIGVLSNLVKRIQNIVIVGAMANNFIKYKGFNIGKSLFEEKQEKTIEEIISMCKKNDCKLFIPEDVVAAKDLDSKGKIKVLKDVGDEDLILDIGKKTTQNILKVIDESKTVLWNGPAGYFEVKQFSHASNKIAQKICENTKNKSLISIAGGGDTVAAINMFGCSDGFTYISTAGGAFLELLEGKILPGIKALEINE
jgi:phosphoglycerate kinase